eukprot:TRINITY_DN27176_c0_g1_i1.p1 TRINITY_DN27176_c0_g1~~TRINITY_DN27176_c0_g1_i1.p1  ORF type:complete len:136 (-),score=9.49 TRINITY_DN27176_c0_g1_i1:48-455(-)
MCIRDRKFAKIIIRRKCKAKWGLFVSGFEFSKEGNHSYGFRLIFINAETSEIQYWPSEKECTDHAPENVMGITTRGAYSFEDVAELDKGTYTVKLQWLYGFNKEACRAAYQHYWGDIRVITVSYTHLTLPTICSV